ncbi:MAG: hypothetical protein ACQEU4_11320 [Bacillota bacterium]
MKKNKVNFLIINQVQRYQMDKNFYHKVSGFDSNLYIKVEGEWDAGIYEWVLEWNEVKKTL